MQPPYTMGTGQFMAQPPQPPQQQPPYMAQQQFRQYGPPHLNTQPPVPPGGNPPGPPRMMGPGQNAGPNMAPNNFNMGPKDDYRKVDPFLIP